VDINCNKTHPKTLKTIQPKNIGKKTTNHPKTLNIKRRITQNHWKPTNTFNTSSQKQSQKYPTIRIIIKKNINKTKQTSRASWHRPRYGSSAGSLVPRSAADPQSPPHHGRRSASEAPGPGSAGRYSAMVKIPGQFHGLWMVWWLDFYGVSIIFLWISRFCSMDFYGFRLISMRFCGFWCVFLSHLVWVGFTPALAFQWPLDQHDSQWSVDANVHHI